VEEAVDAGVDQLVGVLQVVDMGQRHEALACALDDRPIQTVSFFTGCRGRRPRS
jgi:hypothetical protein